MENTYCVYKHTNTENGKVYYGIAEDYLARWKDGRGYESNPVFWSDIIKYGWKNFKHEIMFSNLTKEEALAWEGVLIQESMSYVYETGYNQNKGQAVDYIEITLEENLQDNGNNMARERRGRGGTPVIYKERYYPTAKALADEIDEDAIVISQGLNPNCPRKIPKYLKEGGLRYATELEIEQQYC